MAVSIPYADFQNHNSQLVADGGPWRTQTGDYVSCFSNKASFCRDYIGCVSCTVYVYASAGTFNTKFLVNISVPITQYGNANTLDFTFGYNLMWISDKTAAGTALSSQLTVGSASFTDNFVATQYSPEPPLGDPFYHSGTTNIPKSSDGMLGYIPITIDFTFTREAGSLVDCWMKGLGLQITTPTTSPAVVSASSNVGSSSSSTTSTPIGSSSQSSGIPSLSNVGLPDISQTISTDAFGVSVSSTPLSNPGTTMSNKKMTSVIVGGVVGGLVLLGAFAVFLVLLYKKMIRRLEQGHLDSQTTSEIAGLEPMGRGDQPGRTPYSEWFSPIPSPPIIDEIKSPKFNFPEKPDPMANLTSPLLAVTPASPPATPMYNNNDHSNSQDNTPRRSSHRGRSRGRRRPTADHASAPHPAVPPPPYSDVNETRNERGHNEGGDERTENPHVDGRGALPTGGYDS